MDASRSAAVFLAKLMVTALRPAGVQASALCAGLTMAPP